MPEQSVRLQLSQNLQQMRHDMGLSQARFALMVGLSRQQICELENRSCNPQLKTLERIADGLGIPVWMLLSRKP